MKRTLAAAFVIIAFFLVVLSACSKKRSVAVEPSAVNTPTETNTVDPSAPTSTFTYTPTQTATVTKPAGWIDDCEDTYGPNQNDFHTSGPALNVGGYWITYDDNSVVNNGTSYVWPMSETWKNRKLGTAEPMPPFVMSAPGYPGSAYGTAFAARITGYVAGCTGGPGSWWLDEACLTATAMLINSAEDDHAFRFGFFGMGMQLSPTAGEGNTDDGSGNLIDDPLDCQEVDVSSYTGVRMWVKCDGTNWRIKIPYTNQLNCDGKNGTLAERDACNYQGSSDWGITWQTTTDWELKEFAFADFARESWDTTSCTAPGGDCTKATVLTHVKQIQLQTFGDPSPTLCYPVQRELWVDDIELYQ